MSTNSIPRISRKRKNWRKHLSRQRQISNHNASIEVVQLETRLQMRLSPQTWDALEARWNALPDLDACMPQQRRDFLLHEEAAMDEVQSEIDPAAGIVCRLLVGALTPEAAVQDIRELVHFGILGALDEPEPEYIFQQPAAEEMAQ